MPALPGWLEAAVRRSTAVTLTQELVALFQDASGPCRGRRNCADQLAQSAARSAELELVDVLPLRSPAGQRADGLDRAAGLEVRSEQTAGTGGSTSRS